MKWFRASLALLLVSCDEAPEKGRGSALPESGYRSFEERIEKVILPKVDFKETPLFDVLDTIQSQSELHADDRIGISILVDSPQTDTSGTTITLRMEQTSLKEVLEAVAKQAQLKVIFREELGRADFRSMSYDRTFYKKVFSVSPVFLETLRSHKWGQEKIGAPHGDASIADSLISFLEGNGISFGVSSSAALEIAQGKLTVVNLSEQLDLVAALAKHFDGVHAALMDEPDIHAIAEIRKRLDETILTEVKFEKTLLVDALDRLHRDNGSRLPSMIIDFGVPFDQREMTINTVPVDKGPVTVDLTNVSLGEAFRAILDQANAKLEIQAHAIRMVPKWLPDMVYHIRCFPAPPSVFDLPVTKQLDPFGEAPETSEPANPSSVKDLLMSAGVVFSGEANAVYDSLNQQLVVRSTEDQMELIEAFIKARGVSN